MVGWGEGVLFGMIAGEGIGDGVALLTLIGREVCIYWRLGRWGNGGG